LFVRTAFGLILQSTFFMNKQQIVLNTLVFNQQHLAGESQLNMLQRIVHLGIAQAEVRREFFSDPLKEAPAIKDFVRENHLTLFYSVPEKIFDSAGTLNPNLPTYFAEAQAMGVHALKMNIGHFAAFTGDLTTALSPYANSEVEFNVENDQTIANGSSQNILTFLTAVNAAGVNIQFVFDLGNWRFVNEDELVVADKLSEFTRYIHVKNVQLKSSGAATVVALDRGIIDWQQALQKLPNDVPVALEYPATTTEIQHGIALLSDYH
ncbi:sugar phosphate isomerase/epimerase family protein, partial [Levilactobacillus brevis]